jgi:hypothetical protein
LEKIQELDEIPDLQDFREVEETEGLKKLIKKQIQKQSMLVSGLLQDINQLD